MNDFYEWMHEWINKWMDVWMELTQKLTETNGTFIFVVPNARAFYKLILVVLADAKGHGNIVGLTLGFIYFRLDPVVH